MKKHAQLLLVGFVITIISVGLFPIIGCSSRPDITKPNGEPVNIINNKLARDHTWDVVCGFLRRDRTEEEDYTDSKGSAYFAEKLHNRAEYSNINTGFVLVEYADGTNDCFVAFNTMDHGLVYVDCTGRYHLKRDWLGNIEIKYVVNNKEYENKSYSLCREYGLRWFRIPFPSVTSWDKVAYIEEGKKISYASIDYGCYEGTPRSINYAEKTWNEIMDMFDEQSRKYEQFFNNPWIQNYSDEDFLASCKSRWRLYDNVGVNGEIMEIVNQDRYIVETAKFRSKFVENDFRKYWWEQSASVVDKIQIYW